MMAYADVNEIDTTEIPVIDIGGLFDETPDYAGIGAALRHAAENAGFFYVSNHCIDGELVDAAFAQSAAFFAQEEHVKNNVLAQGYHRGLLPLGVSKMEGHKHPDLKQSYIWGHEFAVDNPQFVAGNELLPPNRWPPEMPAMRKVLTAYMDAAHRCGIALLRAIAVSLDIERDYFVGRFAQPITRGTLIHYPPQPAAMGEDQFGVSPHTDYGTMTLLAQDNNGGLRVQRLDGSWITAHPIADTLVVNVGDLLARWSNDRFRSTPHAVVNTSGNERYSIAIALDPDWDTVVSPVTREGEAPHYDDVRCGDYIRGRFDRSFSYRQQ